MRVILSTFLIMGSAGFMPVKPWSLSLGALIMEGTYCFLFLFWGGSLILAMVSYNPLTPYSNCYKAPI